MVFFQKTKLVPSPGMAAAGVVQRNQRLEINILA
jgi:hypothetical protein